MRSRSGPPPRLLPTSTSGFTDTFQRANGTLGNGWVDLSTSDSDNFNPLGIVSNQVVCTDNTSRPGTPAVEPVGLAYRQMHSSYASAAYVGVKVVKNLHHEPAPILHVVPGTVETGVGVWATNSLVDTLLLVGSIGVPPEDFADYLLASKVVSPIVTGDWLGLLSNGTTFGVYINGVLQTMDLEGGGTGTAITIPANLVGSSKHGFAYDGHNDPTSVNIPVLSQVLIQPTLAG